MDPAVLGTLRVGLDAIDAEARRYEQPRPRPVAVRHRVSGPVRLAVARALRRAAAALDRPSMREATTR